MLIDQGTRIYYQGEINARSSTMKRILFYSLAASAVCAVAIGNADAATRKHHPTDHYRAVAAKLKTVATRRLVVSESSQTSAGRSISADNHIDRDGWRLLNGNWDNTCFRTLGYLSDMSACTGAGN
jgi:hypothetical protein